MHRPCGIPFRALLRVLLPALLALVATRAGLADEQTPATRRPSPGAVIHSGTEPAQGVRVRKLAEKWRAGGDNGQVFFGVIADVTADDAGRVYLLDRQLCQILVYSAEGEPLGTLSKEGDGPGEVRQPRAMVILPEGRIGVLHQVRGRLTCLNPDGTPAPDIVLRDVRGEPQQALSLMEGRRRGPTLAVESFTIVYGDQGRKETRLLGVYDLGGRERYEAYARVQLAFDFERRTFTERLGYNGVWALGPDGSLYLAPERDLYRIEQRGPDGAIIRVIERDYEAHRRTAQEKEAAAGGAVMTINGQQVPLQCDIDDRDPCIEQLYVDDAGGLWVVHSESRSHARSDHVLSYDHIDPSGRYLERVEVADPSDPDHDQLIMLDPEHFVVLRGISDAWQALYGSRVDRAGEGGAEPLEVVYYQVAG
jgi:hypothetical protein